MIRSTITCIGVAAALPHAASARQSCPGEPFAYSMTVLPAPWSAPAPEVNRAYALNEHGDVTGQAGPNIAAFSRLSGASRLLTGSGGDSGTGLTINDAGWIGCNYRFCCNGQFNAAVITPSGQIQPLWDEFYPFGGYVSGINNNNDFVGRNFARPVFDLTPIFWYSSNRLAHQLTVFCSPCCLSQQEAFDVNDNNRIVGITHTCTEPSVLRAYFRDFPAEQITYIDPRPGDPRNIPTSVNNNGDIVGYSFGAALPAGAFIRTVDGTVTPLTTRPGSGATYAWSINESRVVVGGTSTQANGRAWRWTAETGLIDLNTLSDDPDPEWTIVEARGVNNAGEIAATVRRASDSTTRVVLLTPTFCTADWNCDHVLNSADFFDFLTGFFESNADFNDDGVTDSQDFFDFLAAFFEGC
jgi:hypothetical protein